MHACTYTQTQFVISNHKYVACFPSQNGSMPKVDGSKRVSFTLIAVPPGEDSCSDIHRLSSKNGDDESKFDDDNTASNNSSATEPSDRTESGIEHTAAGDGPSHHQQKQTRPIYNPSIGMLQRVMASENSISDWTSSRRNINNPTLLQRRFIKNPSQMPMEAVNLLYSQSLEKQKGNVMHRKFSWCNVHPVVTQYTVN